MKIKNKHWKWIAFFVVISLSLLIVFSNRTLVTGSSNANIIAKELGVGWNLGNTLDAYSTNLDAYEIAQQKRDKYQIMAVYETKQYSGWDASSVPYISEDGSEFILEWDIKNLNSDTKQLSGSFAFQIINQEIENSGIDTLDFTVNTAEFIKSDGSVVKLNDMLGKYSESINNKVTQYIKSDLTKQSKLKTAKEVINGTLKIGVTITQYPMPENLLVSKQQFYETFWGNPVTSKALIDDIKDAGFGTVRIPVTYYNHIDSNGKIDKAWLERVKEVVQYVIDNDMYCIINVHHDTGAKGWLRADPATLNVNLKKYTYIWEQVSDYMKEIDDKLLFEGYNELLNESNKWSWADDESYKAANDLNQAFVNTVRSSGGNNPDRYLIVNTYASSAEEREIKSFILPKDKIKDRLIVQVHYYGSNQSSILAVVERLNKHFVSKGIPVIIGEAGMNHQSTEADRIQYAKYLVSTAKKHNVTVFWWDDGNYAHKEGELSDYALYDRHANKWVYPKIVEALISAAK